MPKPRPAPAQDKRQANLLAAKRLSPERAYVSSGSIPSLEPVNDVPGLRTAMIRTMQAVARHMQLQEIENELRSLPEPFEVDG
jgi:hypothetical protein